MNLLFNSLNTFTVLTCVAPNYINLLRNLSFCVGHRYDSLLKMCVAVVYLGWQGNSVDVYTWDYLWRGSPILLHIY